MVNMFQRFLSFLFGLKKTVREHARSKVLRTGSRPDIPDFRDALYSAVSPTSVLPTRASTEQWLSSVKHQGAMNACVAHAAGLLFETELKKKGVIIDVSELQLYYDARVRGGLFPKDVGCFPRDCFKIMQKEGVVPEKLWPYQKQSINLLPSSLSRSFQRFFKITAYHRISGIQEVKEQLRDGHPVFFSAPVFSSMLRPGSDVPLPKKHERYTGHHAWVLYEYDDFHQNLDGSVGAFRGQNSWGVGWADNGRAWVPYSFLTMTFPGNVTGVDMYVVRV